MINLLVDANIDGHGDLLDQRLQTDKWKEVRDHLDIRVLNFESVGLARTAKDAFVWAFCQEHGYYLLTANRNEESEDSLQATIRREGTALSLPVFTFADAKRIHRSAAYLDEVVGRLLEYLLDKERYNGAGRLYLP
ncbi:MAG: hypothetical protein U0793_21150 [Gemmataceae bacterium]